MKSKGIVVIMTLLKTSSTFLLVSGFGLLLLAGCTKAHTSKAATGGPSSPVALSIPQTSSPPLPHGIKELELGMTLEQVRQSYAVKEDKHPLTEFFKEYFNSEISRKDKAIEKRYFLVSPDAAQLPEYVMWADIYTAHNKVYQIGLHYDEPSVEKIGWNGIISPYLARFGKPHQDTGSRCTWTDDRTRLEIDSSGSTITVNFTDITAENDVKRAERE